MGNVQFIFGSFVLDSGTGQLLQRGQPVPLGSKELALLLALLEARGKVVLKSALMDAAWPNTNVEESSLTVQISALRRKLGSPPIGRAWISTFPRTGYRFSGPFVAEEYEPAPSKVHSGTAEEMSIAVLPFMDVGGEHVHPHFADGLAEDLIVDLSKVPGLFVIASHSSFSLDPNDIEEAARKLGVQYIVGGSVQRAPNRIRINLHLADATSRRTLWAERFEGSLTGIFQLQDKVAAELAAALPNVLPIEVPWPRSRASNIQAYDYFVRGRSLLSHSTNSGLARTLLEKAIELDSDFADAHACLAAAYFGAAVNYNLDILSNKNKGLKHAEIAVSLDPNNPGAHTVLGYVRLYEGKLAEAEKEFDTALRINSNYPDCLPNLAELRVMQGRPEDAIRLVENALRLNPFPPGWYYWDLGFAYYAAGRYLDAVEVLSGEEVRQLPAKRILAASLAQLDRIDDAEKEAARFLEINPGFRASEWAKTQPFEHEEDCQHFVKGFVKAGLPL